MKKSKTSLPKNLEKSLMELNKLTRIVAAPVAIEQLEKLATTDERKAIWVLCSGKLTRDQMSTKSGISLRTVTIFIDMVKTYGLVEEEKEKGGHPKRVIDYVPSVWKKLVKRKKKPSEEQRPKPSMEER